MWNVQEQIFESSIFPFTSSNAELPSAVLKNDIKLYATRPYEPVRVQFKKTNETLTP